MKIAVTWVLLSLPFLTRIFAADCPAGWYSSLNRTCSLCPRGTYQPSRGRPSCISCGPSFTTHSSGTVDKEHCISKSIKSAVISHVEYVKFLCISGPHFLHKRAYSDRLRKQRLEKKFTWSGTHCRHSDIGTFFFSHLSLVSRNYKEQRKNYVFHKKLLQVLLGCIWIIS